jgi:hypothetical protein
LADKKEIKGNELELNCWRHEESIKVKEAKNIK